MERFYSVDPRCDELFQIRFDGIDGSIMNRRMRPHRGPARAVEHLNPFFGRRKLAKYICFFSFNKICLNELMHRSYVPELSAILGIFKDCFGNMRPSDSAPMRLAPHRLKRHGKSLFLEPSHHLNRSVFPILHRFCKHRGESSIFNINAKPENMKKFPVKINGELDSRYDFDAELSPSIDRLENSLNGIMIGNRNGRKAHVMRHYDELAGRILPVGNG